MTMSKELEACLKMADFMCINDISKGMLHVSKGCINAQIEYDLEKSIKKVLTPIGYQFSDEELEAIKMLDEELLPKKEKKFIPEFSETYFWLGVDGVATCKQNNHIKVDDYIINHHPVFKSKEQCKRYAEFQNDLNSLSYKFSIKEWKDVTIKKWFISMRKDMCLESGYTLSPSIINTVYFKNESDIKWLINKYGKEYILHYYFDVWEG